MSMTYHLPKETLRWPLGGWEGGEAGPSVSAGKFVLMAWTRFWPGWPTGDCSPT